MNAEITKLDTPQMGMSKIKATLFTIPMMLLLALMLFSGQASAKLSQRVALILTFIFLNALFYLMLRSGKTDKYRKLFFIVMAVTFVFTFIANLIEIRGSMAITHENVISGNVPFCHLVIPMIIIPAAFTKTIIFPGKMLGGFAPIAAMLVTWFGATLILGRGWCSWVCFFGGLDEGCANLRRKPIIKHIHPKWTYLPHAVLISMVLLSAIAMAPIYCEWLCPFKAVTEFVKIESTKILIQTIIFVTLFVALVVVLPFLTRRRIQCGLFCPFASFQSFTNKINVFEVRIDPNKCKNCKKCIEGCSTFSLDENSIKNGKTLLSCVKCGHCVDNCPQKAATFHIKGTPLTASKDLARILFIYPAFLFGAIMGGGFMTNFIARIIDSFSK